MRRATAFLFILLLQIPGAASRQASIVPLSGANEVPWGVQAIGAPDAWNMTLGRRDVIVAVIDTGVDYFHPDLEASIWNNTDEVPNGIDDDNNGYVDDIRGWNFFDDNNDPMDEFPSSHGTHVAGVIAASLNGFGVVGVAPNVTIMPLKVFGSSTTEGAVGLAAAVRYAMANGAKIISMSLGSAGVASPFMHAIEDAWAAGILLVAATGNSGGSFVDFPAALPEVVAVSALFEDLSIGGFSNRGPLNEIAAPGVRINSTVRHNDSYETVLEVNGTIYRSNWIEHALALPSSGQLVDVGLGRLEDLEGLDLEGRIALLQRGRIGLTEKIDNVVSAGGVGAIVYNNLPGRFYGSLNGSGAIPAVSLSKSDGELLKNLLVEDPTFLATISVQQVAYKLLSGTSMAVPHVSGAAALLWSLNMSLSNHEVRTILDRSSSDRGDPGPDTDYGYGVLNVTRALELLADREAPSLKFNIDSRWNSEKERIEISLDFVAEDDMGIFSVVVTAFNGSGVVLPVSVLYNQERDPIFTGAMEIAYPSYLGNMTLRIVAEDVRNRSAIYEVPSVVMVPQQVQNDPSPVFETVTFTATQSVSENLPVEFIFPLTLALLVMIRKRWAERL